MTGTIKLALDRPQAFFRSIRALKPEARKLFFSRFKTFDQLLRIEPGTATRTSVRLILKPTQRAVKLLAALRAVHRKDVVIAHRH